MRILLIILLFLTTKVYAEKFNGLFGIEFFQNYQEMGIFDTSTIQKMDIQELKNLEEKTWNTGTIKIKTKIEPLNKNEDFDEYYIYSTPLSGLVIQIIAKGKFALNKDDCEDRKEFYKIFFKKKYSSSYDVAAIRNNEIIRLKKLNKIDNTWEDHVEIQFNCTKNTIWAGVSPKKYNHFLSDEGEKIRTLVRNRITELTIENNNSDNTGL
ncbi:hypothetical protein OAJ30_02410 [Alphaproteobacteria bacterium]|nr:hypothetical protein [Alphaproteobacteria bacterium]